MCVKSVKPRLSDRWTKTVRNAQGRLSKLKAALRMRLYDILGEIHLALITDAGLIIVAFAPFLFGAQLIPQRITLTFFLGYIVCDLIRLRFLRGVTISLGFPLIFLTLLADSPFAALLVGTLGSWVSETLYSKLLSKHHLSWFQSLRRAFFYAGHHAVASQGALIAWGLTRYYSNPWLVETIHIQATLVYIVTYSLVSMLLVWPQDRRIRLFLAPNEEPFVRVDFLSTLMLVPVPVSIFYLHNLIPGQAGKILIVVGVLPALFVLLFYLARNFAKIEESQERLALREQISDRLGSPANMAEMVESVLKILGRLVDYHWGAVYSALDGKLKLYGIQPSKGPMILRDPSQARQTEASSIDTEIDENQVTWPLEIGAGEGTLAKLIEEPSPTQFFQDGLMAPPPTDPYLPRNTALMVLPITVESHNAEGRQTSNLIGMVALARPKRRFTTWDWEKSQALSEKAAKVLLSTQRLEKAIRDLYQKVEDYAKDPERVRQAIQELIQKQVDVGKILAVIAERSFRGDVRAVLEGAVTGQRTAEITLAPEALTKIYNQVRDETPGMPPVNPEILRLLRTVTSSLSLAFSFRYQFPEVERGPAFKEFYEFLLVALDANTISRIETLDPQIASTVEAIRKREATEAESSPLPSQAIEEVERLRGVIHLLKEHSETEEPTAQGAFLSQALEQLTEREEAVRERLRDPERFIFLQILSVWRTAITNALTDQVCGPARLKVRLRSHRALTLEKVTTALVLQNEGPGAASRVVIQLKPSPGYRVLEGQADLGTLIAGKSVEPEFVLRPTGEGPLRLQFCITYHDPERKDKAEEFADLLHLREAPTSFTEIPNPYTPGLPLKPGNPTFVGREDIFEFIRQNIPALAQKMILVLIGERRTGKTSILQQLPHRLNDPRYIPIFVDGQALGIDRGMESFFLSLATAISDGLETVGSPMTFLTPSELRDGAQHIFERRFLPQVRERIGERILLLTIDEFEELGDRVRQNRLPQEIFPYLRHLIQHEEQLAFIFAGTHKIEEFIGSYWSVLFNIAKYKKVGFLNREETTHLITEPVRPSGMVYDDLAIDEIMRLTACHPYFTQLLCNILVNRCNEAHRSYVTVQDVRDAVEELLETGRAHLTFLWQTSNREAMLTLAALAELRRRSGRVTAAALAARLSEYQTRLDPGQITKAMEQLEARDITREIPGNPVSYDFTAQLYTHWLHRYKSLSKVVEEISSA